MDDIDLVVRAHELAMIDAQHSLNDYKEMLKEQKKEAEFHCGVEESGGHAYNCNDCPNKCEEWYQWDKEFREKGYKDGKNI